MKPETALARTVEDERVSILVRCKALEKLQHPPMELLRRLLVDSKKTNKPVPHRLRALASLKFAVEVQHKNARRERRRTRPIGKAFAFGSQSTLDDDEVLELLREWNYGSLREGY